MHKILIAHSLYSPHVIGGAEISTQILAQTMSRHYEVEVLTVGKHRQREVRLDHVNGIDVVRLPYNNRYWIGDVDRSVSVPSKIMWRLQDVFNVRQYQHIKQYLAKTRPELVHTQNLPGLSLAIWRAAHEMRIPVVHTLRDFSLIDPINLSLYSKMYRTISRRFSRTISSVIGISNHILGSHTSLGFFADSNKYVIHNIVESAESVTDLYKEKEVNVNRPLKIGYFGQLTEVKGVHYLIDAIKSLDRNIAGQLFIFGEGPLLSNLQQSAASDDRIEFKGKVAKSEIAGQMAAMDVIIVPSTWDEPFGRVVIEAYQVGTPVYASRVGGMSEILLDTEEFAFPAHSTEAIARSIQHYYRLSEPEKLQLKDRCHLHSQTFNEAYLLQEHMDIYEKLIR